MRLNNLLPTATNYCLKREPGKSNGWERLKKDDRKARGWTVGMWANEGCDEWNIIYSIDTYKW